LRHRLSIKDFVIKFNDGDRSSHSIRPLQLVQIERSIRLLVVSCHYVMAERHSVSADAGVRAR
jgi:hypothetical protein